MRLWLLSGGLNEGLGEWFGVGGRLPPEVQAILGRLVKKSPARYFFVSREFLGPRARLRLSVSGAAADEPQFQRLCVAGTLAGACSGAGAWDYNEFGRGEGRGRYWVYVTDPVVAYGVPDDLVADASLSAEHWVFRPVGASFLRVITVDEASELVREIWS